MAVLGRRALAEHGTDIVLGDADALDREPKVRYESAYITRSDIAREKAMAV